jgi:hypothetical protein
VPLADAIEYAVQGKSPDPKKQHVTLNGHGFNVSPVTIIKDADGVTAEGFFYHRHRGKDDRIHYKIVAKKGQPYSAILTKIEYRGPLNALNNKVVQLGVDATGAAVGGPVGAAAAEAIQKVLKKLKLHRLFDGKWEREATKIVDELGKRVAKEAK